VKEAQNICKYITWADIQSVVLTVGLTADDYTNCASLATDVNNFYLNIN
jgi:hypothetical protein